MFGIRLVPHQCLPVRLSSRASLTWHCVRKHAALLLASFQQPVQQAIEVIDIFVVETPRREKLQNTHQFNLKPRRRHIVVPVSVGERMAGCYVLQDSNDVRDNGGPLRWLCRLQETNDQPSSGCEKTDVTLSHQLDHPLNPLALLLHLEHIRTPSVQPQDAQRSLPLDVCRCRALKLLQQIRDKILRKLLAADVCNGMHGQSLESLVTFGYVQLQ
mmetsp:Transcript_849/g.2064  ORF Transcript_849/g.2064 Transcript_849/m.2064 type:complete len:215 (-) Transcript_849:344-988(-)